LKLDILENFAYECSVDAKISKYIQERIPFISDPKEKKCFFDKILRN
jgi:hypothetical protein